MKKILFCFLFAAGMLHGFAQNVGIGTTPYRAKFEVHGAVGNTSAIFGGEGVGISLQRNPAAIGFNTYYINGYHRTLAGGHGAMIALDHHNGYLAFDVTGSAQDGEAVYPRRGLVISKEGRVNIASAGLPNANLNVARGNFSPHYATAAFEGSQHHSFFNYGENEHTYIRAGKGNGTLFLNDVPGGKIAMTGPVGINTAAPTAPLEIRQIGSQSGLVIVNGNTFHNWAFKVPAAGGLTMYNDGIYVGHFWPDGQYDATSDSRVKTNVQPLPALLDKIMQLRPVIYEMIYQPAHKKRIGFLAQEVKHVLPDLISVTTDSTNGYDGINDLHTLNYYGFGVLAIKVVQEQQQLIKTLQEQLKELEQIVSGIRRFIKQ